MRNLVRTLPPPVALATARVERAPSRQKVIADAQALAQMSWTPSQRNVFHGVDPDGVRVETPDLDYIEGGFVPGQRYTGMPYCWGGFSSIPEFKAGIAAGAIAGFVFKDDPANHPSGSKHAVGLDCSGFVSRCWGLTEKQDTKTLTRLSRLLPRYEDLLPGDILNDPGHHVYLFKEFVDPAKTRVRVLEANIPKVRQVELTVAELKAGGFEPRRDNRRAD